MNAESGSGGCAAPALPYFDLLTDLIEELAHARDLSQMLRPALSRIADAMQAEAAALFLLEDEWGDDRARLVCQASVGPSDITGLALPVRSGIVGRALASGSVQIVADPQHDPDFVPPPSAGAPFQVRSLICAPLLLKGQALGVVELVNRRDDSLFCAADAELLAALAVVAAMAISNARLAQERVDRERLQRELELAGAVQRTLLPKPQAESAAVHGLNRPARGVSGDFYDILALPDGRTVFALADVSGKGMNAALVMVKAATLFRSWARRVSDPGRLLARIESELCETMSFGMFVTMVVGIYDPRRHSVRISNAGHEPPLLRRGDGSFDEFPASDPPLGVVCKLENNRYRETEIALDGGTLYLYTDGATEGRLLDGSLADAGRVRAIIAEHAEEPAALRLDSIAAHYSEELRDDLTWLIVEGRRGDSQHARSARRRRDRLLVSQSLPAQADQLKIVRRLVEAAARSSGASAQWASDLALAVDEACQNIIRHGYKGVADGRIGLAIRRRREELIVELEDSAPRVERSALRGRALDDLRPGGLGTHFMHQLTDRVRWRVPSSGNGNRMVLSKKLGGGDGA
jgi:sigma-B regulation protein RsbU (phosphoserine phosphatase)